MPGNWDLIVVGVGAAGLGAARGGAAAGARVLLVSEGEIGGGCAFTGCVPSTTLIEAAACGLPAEVLPVGLDRLALSLERHILRWRLERQQDRIQAERGEVEDLLKREIFERRKTERTLRENETRMQDILDNVAGWVWEVDAKGVCTYSSAHVEQLFGYPPEEILGRDVFPLLQPETAEESRSAFFARAAEGGEIKDLIDRSLRFYPRIAREEVRVFLVEYAGRILPELPAGAELAPGDAVRLGFEHPDSGRYVEYEAEYPADLAAALDRVRDGH